MVSPGPASCAHCEATPPCSANSMSTVSATGLGSDQRVAALMQPLAVREPHPDPHRRVQRPIGQQAAGIEAQPQVVRAELAAAGDGHLVIARAQRLEHGALESAHGTLSDMPRPRVHYWVSHEAVGPIV